MSRGHRSRATCRGLGRATQNFCPIGGEERAQISWRVPVDVISRELTNFARLVFTAEKKIRDGRPARIVAGTPERKQRLGLRDIALHDCVFVILTRGYPRGFSKPPSARHEANVVVGG